ncbi:hypothetical protein DPMN_123743 [Dreissena polymorpha]|uniref:Uncharacterized protein n=1 Tax=Dreissena polymorpha TaxID=45954 RepID=A0A9D4JRK4_DREPO|nr:hypothetical protein DPMN_123743 [Dreissena polymorpha]
MGRRVVPEVVGDSTIRRANIQTGEHVTCAEDTLPSDPRKSSARRVCSGPHPEAVTDKYCALTAGKPDEVLGKKDILSRSFHDMEFNRNRSTSRLNAGHEAEAYNTLTGVLPGRLRDEDKGGRLWLQDCSRTGCASFVWIQMKTDLAIVDPT